LSRREADAGKLQESAIAGLHVSLPIYSNCEPPASIQPPSETASYFLKSLKSRKAVNGMEHLDKPKLNVMI